MRSPDRAAARPTAGPTVVLDQRHGETVPAASAHISHPADGCVLMFPGDRLHGVLPSRHATHHATTHERRRSAERAARPPEPRAPHEGLRTVAGLPRRVTLMIGFWARDVGGMMRRAPFSACSTMPRASRASTWPSLLAEPLEEPPSRRRMDSAGSDRRADAVGAAAATTPMRHAVLEVRPAWEALPQTNAPSEGEGGRTATVDAWALAGEPLRLPEDRDNHFFVRGMEDFLYLERDDEGEQ